MCGGTFVVTIRDITSETIPYPTWERRRVKWAAMKTSRTRTPILTISPTSSVTLGQLESIIIKPGVMRGCFGAALAPRQAREILLREWQACQTDRCGTHLTVSCLRRGRPEVAGAGYLLDGELRLFVTPELHRQGLGRALVMALLCEADQRHLHELNACVFPENLASARLLEACGFMPRASMQTGSYERPVVHYQLPLDSAPARLFGNSDAARQLTPSMVAKGNRLL